MKWTLPNILTLLRLAAAPSVPIIILYFQQPLSYLIALAIFVLAGMTDFIDGYLARL
jgi:CDP-diacylglycerol--glycerol-3-phosphate 3-phosphatidyltransferase